MPGDYTPPLTSLCPKCTESGKFTPLFSQNKMGSSCSFEKVFCVCVCVCVFNSPWPGAVDSICKLGQCNPIVSPPGLAFNSWVTFLLLVLGTVSCHALKASCWFTELTFLSTLSSKISSLPGGIRSSHPMSHLGPDTTLNSITEPFDTRQEKIACHTLCASSSSQTVTQRHGCIGSLHNAY